MLPYSVASVASYAPSISRRDSTRSTKGRMPNPLDMAKATLGLDVQGASERFKAIATQKMASGPFFPVLSQGMTCSE